MWGSGLDDFFRVGSSEMDRGAGMGFLGWVD